MMMKIPQKKFREVVFQVLYSFEYGESADLSSLKTFISRELAVSKKTVEEALIRVLLIVNKQDLLDEWVAKTATSYQFERIHPVEKNVLRLGLYELLYDKAIPPKVAIAEAIRLAKKFASPESLTFINAIMDQIKRAQEEK